MNSIRNLNRFFPYIAPLVLAAALPLTALAAPPPVAAAQGFNDNTFSSNFTAQTVDMNRTQNRGFKWYMFDLFSKTASATGVQLNPDGSVTLVDGSYLDRLARARARRQIPVELRKRRPELVELAERRLMEAHLQALLLHLGVVLPPE